jgi:hypothetical protein
MYGLIELVGDELILVVGFGFPGRLASPLSAVALR